MTGNMICSKEVGCAFSNCAHKKSHQKDEGCDIGCNGAATGSHLGAKCIEVPASPAPIMSKEDFESCFSERWDPVPDVPNNPNGISAVVAHKVVCDHSIHTGPEACPKDCEHKLPHHEEPACHRAHYCACCSETVSCIPLVAENVVCNLAAECASRSCKHRDPHTENIRCKNDCDHPRQKCIPASVNPEVICSERDTCNLPSAGCPHQTPHIRNFTCGDKGGCLSGTPNRSCVRSVPVAVPLPSRAKITTASALVNKPSFICECASVCPAPQCVHSMSHPNCAVKCGRAEGIIGSKCTGLMNPHICESAATCPVDCTEKEFYDLLNWPVACLVKGGIHGSVPIPITRELAQFVIAERELKHLYREMLVIDKQVETLVRKIILAEQELKLRKLGCKEHL